MILRKEIDSYNLHIEEIKKYANEHDLLKGKYFARYYINEGEIYNNVINGETIKFYETNILEDYLHNIIEEQYIRKNINNFLNELDKYTKNYYSQKLKSNH